MKLKTDDDILTDYMIMNGYHGGINFREVRKMEKKTFSFQSYLLGVRFKEFVDSIKEAVRDIFK